MNGNIVIKNDGDTSIIPNTFFLFISSFFISNINPYALIINAKIDIIVSFQDNDDVIILNKMDTITINDAGIINTIPIFFLLGLFIYLMIVLILIKINPISYSTKYLLVSLKAPVSDSLPV